MELNLVEIDIYNYNIFFDCISYSLFFRMTNLKITRWIEPKDNKERVLAIDIENQTIVFKGYAKDFKGKSDNEKTAQELIDEVE